jgi:hypothetical protein
MVRFKRANHKTDPLFFIPTSPKIYKPPPLNKAKDNYYTSKPLTCLGTLLVGTPKKLFKAIIYSHPPSRFTWVGNVVFGRTANLGGASSWEIEGPRAAYSTQLRGY